MARPMVWVTSLLPFLFTLSTSLTQTGPPPPSSVECSIPSEINDESGIHCSWDPGQDHDSQTATSYSLHWNASLDDLPRPPPSRRTWVEASSVGGVIPRSLVPRFGFLTVWVRAENQHGSADSQEVFFNPEDIMMPPTPIIVEHSEDPVEIIWRTRCEEHGLSERNCKVRYRAEGTEDWPEVRNCKVRYRAEGAEDWPEEEEDLQNSFLFLSPQPFTVYQFQVSCACEERLPMSEWSSVYSLRSAEAAPVGELDVWSDCEPLSDLSQCAIMWKELPPSLARGEVLGYVLVVEYANGTVAAANESAADHGGEGKRRHRASSLQGVSEVRVSAYNSQGATQPASLAVFTHVPQVPEQKLSWAMDGGNLSVSWDLSPDLPDRLRELVVQYKQAGLPPSKGFDWMKVNNTQTSISLTGSFENYAAYVVSLIAVSRNKHVLLASAVAYALQDTPPAVPWINVWNISDSEVTVTWGDIPLSQRRGLISRYQLWTDNQTVYTASGKKNRFVLSGLSPGSYYELSLRAETEAGLGLAKTISFSTQNDGYIYMVLFVPIVLVAFIFIIIISLMFKRESCPLVPVWCYEKVPDPSNSQLFKQMTSQLNGSFIWFCAPSEPNPKICHLEVVLIQPQDITAFPGKTDVGEGEESAQSKSDGEGDEGEDVDGEGEWVLLMGRNDVGGEDYSNMVDTDEERDGGDGASNLSEKEERFFSDYEKHFMPTAMEV